MLVGRPGQDWVQWHRLSLHKFFVNLEQDWVLLCWLSELGLVLWHRPSLRVLGEPGSGRGIFVLVVLS